VHPVPAASLGAITACRNCERGSNCYLASKSYRMRFASRGPPPRFNPVHGVRPGRRLLSDFSPANPTREIRALPVSRSYAERETNYRPLITRLRSRSATQRARFVIRGEGGIIRQRIRNFSVASPVGNRLCQVTRQAITLTIVICTTRVILECRDVC